ncbi:unnamed protein product [Cladocopium goreaui]|uniref:Uncharacterized protein n=1 Tax=Cladocopium goreaui TaxID=2562237 RepID=A0A9P1FW07_9DINO|nr:unnamed protein product [Cladocopium goreaui]
MAAGSLSHWPGPVTTSSTSFATCPAPHIQALDAQAPACLEGGRECESLPERAELKAFARSIDQSLKDALETTKEARKRFERRVCDYRYAEIEDKGQVLADAYGPNGPMKPGGSYLYELRRWVDAVQELNHECSLRQGDVCVNLLSYLRNYPQTDQDANGGHGVLGSKLYNEIRLACEVGKKRAPVPNDSPVWCDNKTKLCERTSCRHWWHEVHPLKAQPHPWVDDRIEYDQLKNICTAIERPQIISADLDRYQKTAEAGALHLREEFCTPKWIDGYCEAKVAPRLHAKCTLENGQYCKKGLVHGGSDADITQEWSDAFKEPAVQVSQMAFWLQSPTRAEQKKTSLASFL